jgi:molybdopterin/thiamine biosynthesis adenylyltransferase
MKLARISTRSPRSTEFRTVPVRPKVAGEADVWDRMAKLEGYDVQAWHRTRVALIGAGAASVVAWALVRKGVGRLIIFDGDQVEISNLPRQFYYGHQRFKNKAMSLAKNLSLEGPGDTTIEAFPVMFQTKVERGGEVRCDLAVCLVDNDDTRAFVARYFYGRGVPVVFAAFNRQSEGAYCFVQESRPDTPCFGCLSPGAVRAPRETPCGLGANVDIVLVTAGLISWAIDVLLGNRPMLWRYKEVSLAGYDKVEGSRDIVVRSSCPICRGVA